MQIIVDGYNVLQHIAKGQGGPKEKERFIAQMVAHAQTSAHQITLVFDGGSTLVPAREKIGKLTIIHTGHHETADDYIARMVQKESGNPVVMVSSDHQLQSAARRWGAKSMEARTFADLIAEPEREKATPMPTSRKGAHMIQRRGAEGTDELAQVLEQESRSLPVKEDERIAQQVRIREKQAKRVRKVLKKL